LGFEDEDGGRRERDVADWRLKMKMVGEGCGWLAFEDEDAERGMWLTVVQ
jgi:hypothetical protein